MNVVAASFGEANMAENSARVANGGLRGMGRGQPGGRALRLR